MLSFIKKVNQYTLQRYPTIWNLRLVWVLSITTLFHIIFFLIGFCLYRNPAKFCATKIYKDFFESGLIYVSIISSILILVIWLAYLVKNNAFKSYYPTSWFSLFLQFFAYFGVMLYALAFFYSYYLGLLCFVKTEYPNDLVNKEIKLINYTVPFLPFDLYRYGLNYKMYPAPFDTLYCEAYTEEIDFSQSYQGYDGTYYQFYTVKRQSVPRYSYSKSEEPLIDDYITYKKKENSFDILQKEKIVDVSKYIDNAEPSFLNYNTFFIDYDSIKAEIRERGSEHYERKFIEEEGFTKNECAYDVNKHTVELLKNNDKKRVLKQLHEFLQLSKKYQVPNDLDEEEWLNNIYKKADFSVGFLLLSKKPEKDSINPETHDIVDITEYEQHIDSRQTKQYYQIEDLYRVYYNIDKIRNQGLYRCKYLINNFLWFALAGAGLLFLFRTAGIKPLILALLSSGIISIIAIASSIFLENLYEEKSFYHQNEEKIQAFVVIIFCLILLISATISLKRKKKIYSAVLLNLSIIAPLLIYGSILVLIAQMKTEIEPDLANKDYFNLHFNKLVLLGVVISLFYMLYYSYVIKKWKALPES